MQAQWGKRNSLAEPPGGTDEHDTTRVGGGVHAAIMPWSGGPASGGCTPGCVPVRWCWAGDAPGYRGHDEISHHEVLQDDPKRDPKNDNHRPPPVGWAAALGEVSMTTPDEGLPFAGTAKPGNEHDPEAAEAYAESVGIDPSQDEIDQYLEIAGAAPLVEQPDSLRTDEG